MRILSLLVVSASLCAFAFPSGSYTNRFVRDGVTYVQRGQLTPADYVVTNVVVRSDTNIVIHSGEWWTISSASTNVSSYLQLSYENEYLAGTIEGIGFDVYATFSMEDDTAVEFKDGATITFDNPDDFRVTLYDEFYSPEIKTLQEYIQYVGGGGGGAPNYAAVSNAAMRAVQSINGVTGTAVTVTAASIGALPTTGGTVNGAVTVEYEDPSWQSTGVINVGSGGNIGAVINVRGNGEQITLRSGGWGEQAYITLGSRRVATTTDVEEFAANHSSPVASSGAIAWSANPVSVSLATGASLSCTGSWPYSKPVFVRVVPNGTYSPASNIRLIGYGTWPTSAFQAVAWYVGGTYYFNVLVEE